MTPGPLVQLAGSAAAHALSTMGDEPLVPFLVSERTGGERALKRFAVTPTEAQQMVFPMLEAGIPEADRAILAVGGFVDPEGQLNEGLALDGADWALPLDLRIRIFVTPKTLKSKLKVTRMDVEDVERGTPEYLWVRDTIAAGMAAHPAGNEWASVIANLN